MKTTLPSLEEINEIKKACERERSEAVWLVLAAPFAALRNLLEYTGNKEVANHDIAGAAAQ